MKSLFAKLEVRHVLDPPLPMSNARMGLRCGPLVIVVPRYFHVEGICFVGMFKIRGKLNLTYSISCVLAKGRWASRTNSCGFCDRNQRRTSTNMAATHLSRRSNGSILYWKPKPRLKKS